MTSSRRVLVLGNGQSAFLAVIRSLARHGLRVHTAWAEKSCAALSSRCIHSHHELPRPLEGSGWDDAFLDLLEQIRFDLVVPTNEQSMRALHQKRHRLNAATPLFLHQEQYFETVFDKAQMHELARSSGVPVPETWRVVDAADLDRILPALQFPVVVKPTRSFTPRTIRIRQAVKWAHAASDTRFRVMDALEFTPVLIQRPVRGYGVGFEVLADRGKILASFQHVRLHEPSGGGASSYRISVPPDPLLAEYSARLLAAVDYSGVAMLEFLRDPDTGGYCFLELNARFWGSLPLAVAAGVDFPAYLYDLIVHSRRTFPQTYAIGVTCREAAGDMRWMINQLRARPDSAKPVPPETPSALAQLARWMTGRECFDLFQFADPTPSIVEVQRKALRLSGHLAQSLSRRIHAFAPLRALQRRRLLTSLGAVRTIVFVCLGNICRSPFAAAYLRLRVGDQLTIRSSGLRAVDGRFSPFNARLAARPMGVALDDHRASALDEDLLDSADVIFTFGETIHAELLRKHPQAGRRAWRFGILDDDRSLDVADPDGDSLEQFEACYRRIAAGLDALVDKLPGAGNRP